ncbi:MAG: flagellar hook-associated protein FlgK [Alphaproteobacteria bacterium]|nr:flagellar hook-associated protein FlgK [Alphaproteobacteria bacterium]
MSISGALFNAYSGLVAAARTAEAVSNNVSNALTDGYGRRKIELVAASTAGRGTGVRVATVLRDVDLIAIADRRLAQATAGGKGVNAAALVRMETVIGIPGDGGSLSDLVTKFEGALLSAQSRPDSQVRLQNTLYAASDLVTQINNISNSTQQLRVDADKSIGNQVELLNKSLTEIAELNRSIRAFTGAGNSPNGLKDQRQRLIDGIADIIPIKTYPRDKGEIAVFSASGAVLLDGLPGEFGFAAAGLITPDMTLTSGALSGLTLNGKSIAISGRGSLIGGGTLSASFDVRDNAAPFASSQIDAFARNLMERFESSGLDASLSTGDAGLFTDAGAALVPADEVGLAGRLAINAAVDPNQGGALWRLRDGLGATAPGETGDRTLITGFIEALTGSQATNSGQFSAGAVSLGNLAGDLTALNASARLDAEQSEVFATSRFRELYLVELESGVDTDQEMQKLLLIETAYAANARVITTVDAMLQSLLEI